MLRSIFGNSIKFLSKRYHSSTMDPSKYLAMPKVELHVHADGAIRLGTLQELSRQHGCPYPHDDIEKFRNLVSLSEPKASLKEFLDKFEPITDILRTKEALERIAYEFCEDCAKQNILYAEYRYFPFYGLPSSDEYCQGIMAGLERGQKEFNVKVRSILCFMRERPDVAMDTVKLAQKYRPHVVGVDIAGNELLPLSPLHITAFQEAKRLGLHVTAHAGESGPASNIREAAEEMGAERIGHGYHVVDDEEVYKFAKDKGLHFETCPTSSVFTNTAKFEDHSISKFVSDGVSFSLNTDDPGIIFNCSLSGECDVVERHMGLTQHQIMNTVVCGAEAAFLPPTERAELVKTIKEKLKIFDSTFCPQ